MSVRAYTALFAMFFCLLTNAFADEAKQKALAADLARLGKAPVEYVAGALEKHDLLIFDEGLHTAKEPWDFYEALAQDKRIARHAPIFFLEVIPYNQQKHLDAFLASEDGDLALAYPAFQNALTSGWHYQTYFDFLKAVHQANKALPAEKRMRIVAVSPASYWSEIETPSDYRTYRTAGYADYDYGMYARIAQAMGNFEAGAKGMFLTNTRHAYTALKQKDGSYFWNAGTWFRQRHGDKVHSIRINAPFLEVKQREKTDDLGQGLAGVTYGWIRADSGAWDRAFRANGDKPIALSLAGTVFGAAPYVGNRMLTAAPGQTMANVNDAIIHLKRLEDWHETGHNGPMYTDEFKAELARRFRAVNTPEDLQKMMTRNEVETVEDLVEVYAAPRGPVPLPQAQGLSPLE